MADQHPRVDPDVKESAADNGGDSAYQLLAFPPKAPSSSQGPERTASS